MALTGGAAVQSPPKVPGSELAKFKPMAETNAIVKAKTRPMMKGNTIDEGHD